MNNNISPVSFCGVRIDGPISSKNMEKAGEFLTQTENIQFVQHLEQVFETDIVLKEDLSQMSFCHHKYGNLFGKYKCPWFSADKFFKDVMEIFSSIKKSISLAEKDAAKSAKEYEKVRRGC